MNSQLNKLQQQLIQKAEQSKFEKNVATQEKLISFFDDMIKEFIKPIQDVESTSFEKKELKDGYVYTIFGNQLSVYPHDNKVKFRRNDEVNTLLSVNYLSGSPKVSQQNYQPKKLNHSDLESVIINAFK